MDWRLETTRIPVIRALIRWGEQSRSRKVLSEIQPHIPTGASILDLGAGTCVAANMMQTAGYAVTAVDVADYSVMDDLHPTVYDGDTLPFEDQSFDFVILAFVLHHTPDPDGVIAEARRVARELIILEDVVTGRWHRWVTIVLDSVLNLEFFNHPHTNRSDAQWRQTFENQSLEITSFEMSRSSMLLAKPIIHARYVLARRSES